jgi:Lamin Tail Domain
MLRQSVLAVALTCGTLAAPAPTRAVPTPFEQAVQGHVYIDLIQYNPPGPDRPATNRKLNEEVVVITNGSSTVRHLRGWTLRDRKADGHVYTFPRTRLSPGHAVAVHTGKSTSPLPSAPHQRYWGLGHYVWKNTGDRARLYNRAGTLVDACLYEGKPSGTATC